MSSHRPLLIAASAILLAGAVACGGDDPAMTDTLAVPPGDTLSATQPAPIVGGDTTPLSDPSTVAALDSVVAAGDRGLTSLAPAVAIPLIQRLEDRLDASNIEALDEIATDLESLREELDDDTIDGPDVGDILTRLGQKTTAVAGNAQLAGAAAGTLQRLGQMLTQAGQQLKPAGQ